MTINQFHTTRGLDISPSSIKKRIDRSGLGRFGLNDELSQEAREALTNWYIEPDQPDQPEEQDRSEPITIPEQKKEEERQPNQAPKQEPAGRPKESPTPPKKKPADPEEVPTVNFQEPKNPWYIFWRKVAPNAPLPMLGLAASYGVYFFAKHFSPTWVAISEAAAFEMTYIGLAALEGLTEEQRQRANWVSIAAVGVSVIYNTIAAAIHQRPDILEDLSLGWLWAVSIIHGAPLAILAYLVADLLFHRNK